jgi:hypothetical protein
MFEFAWFFLFALSFSACIRLIADCKSKDRKIANLLLKVDVGDGRISGKDRDIESARKALCVLDSETKAIKEQLKHARAVNERARAVLGGTE